MKDLFVRRKCLLYWVLLCICMESSGSGGLLLRLTAISSVSGESVIYMHTGLTSTYSEDTHLVVFLVQCEVNG